MGQKDIIWVMNARVRMLVIVACLAILAQPFAYAIPGRDKRREEERKEEKLIKKIAHETNPGKKAKLQIKLAKMKLDSANDAYRRRDFSEGKSLLQQYLDQVKTSWSTLEGAGEPVKKHLGAFMKLEMTLSSDVRFLEDLRRSIPYPESEFVKKVEKECSAVHTQVLQALFPDGYSRRHHSSHKSPGKSTEAAGAAKP